MRSLSVLECIIYLQDLSWGQPALTLNEDEFKYLLAVSPLASGAGVRPGLLTFRYNF